MKTEEAINQNNTNQPKVRFKNRTFWALLEKMWLKSWAGEPPDKLLFFLAITTSILMAFPLVYVVWRSMFAGIDRWARLWDTRIPMIMKNTLSLSFVVTFLATSLGVSLAFLVERCNVVGRNLWKWILALPLVIPPYVGAVTYIIILGPRGWLFHWLGRTPINLYSFWGTVFVLTMFTYPYVFLITSSSLKRMNGSYEAAARSLGVNGWGILWKVTLPLLRPAIGAGAILIALYVLSDFGAIAMLRYTTFTSAIYYQMGSYDNVSATVLSLVLIVLTIGILYLESLTKRKGKYFQMSSTFKRIEPIQLRWLQIPAIIFISIIFMVSFLLPLIVLIYWSIQGIALGALNQRFWIHAFNSIKVASMASVICMIISLPIVYLKSRYSSNFTLVVDKLSYSGYSLPGVIVALGIIFVFNNYIPWLYNTYFLISIAYVIRFLPQSLQAGESALSLVSPRIDEGARSLGYSPWTVLQRVIIPLITPSILAGGAMVFVSSIKELPATLLLRPPGYDTLAVRVWVETSEAVYHMAAPAALLIILVSIIPLKWMLNKY